MLTFLGKVLFKILLTIFIHLFCLLFWQHVAFAQVVINEVHPAPSSGNDWIELKNTGSDSVSLTSWTLEDTSGAMPTNPTLNNLNMSAQSYLAIEVSNRLNNGGDSVILKNPSGQTIDQFSYLSSQSDMSWSRN